MGIKVHLHRGTVTKMNDSQRELSFIRLREMRNEEN